MSDIFSQPKITLKLIYLQSQELPRIALFGHDNSKLSSSMLAVPMQYAAQFQMMLL